LKWISNEELVIYLQPMMIDYSWKEKEYRCNFYNGIKITFIEGLIPEE
jgi:hypothetical protein